MPSLTPLISCDHFTEKDLTFGAARCDQRVTRSNPHLGGASALPAGATRLSRRQNPVSFSACNSEKKKEKSSFHSKYKFLPIC